MIDWWDLSSIADLGGSFGIGQVHHDCPAHPEGCHTQCPSWRAPLLDTWIPGLVRPKGSLKRGKNGRTFESNPNSVANARHLISTLNAIWGGLETIRTPVVLRLHCYYPRPKTSRFELPTTTATGDWDKLGRQVGDALTRAGVWADDSLVADGRVIKRYAKDGEQPGVRILIWTA